MQRSMQIAATKQIAIGFRNGLKTHQEPKDPPTEINSGKSRNQRIEMIIKNPVVFPENFICILSSQRRSSLQEFATSTVLDLDTNVAPRRCRIYMHREPSSGRIRHMKSAWNIVFSWKLAEKNVSVQQPQICFNCKSNLVLMLYCCSYVICSLCLYSDSNKGGLIRHLAE